MLEDEEDDEAEEDDAAAAVAPTLAQRKIESIVWQRENGGKMYRAKLTDYKLEATLMDLISAGITADFNQGVNFVGAVDMDVAGLGK